MSDNEPNELDVKPLVLGPQDQDRITIVLQFHHQHYMEQPTTVSSAHSEMLETTVEPYSRRVTLTEEWRPIDFGWVEPGDVKYIVVENYEGKKFAVTPSPEEMKEIENRVIEVAYVERDGEMGKSMLVAPRSCQYFHTKFAGMLRLRCSQGTAKGRVNIIAR